MTVMYYLDMYKLVVESKAKESKNTKFSIIVTMGQDGGIHAWEGVYIVSSKGNNHDLFYMLDGENKEVLTLLFCKSYKVVYIFSICMNNS